MRHFKERFSLLVSAARPFHSKMTKKRKYPFSKIRLKIWGSSHTNDNHGVPPLLDAHLLKSSRYRPAEYDSRGGREFDDGIVDAIKYDIDASVAREEPFVIVICIGTNNIRQEGEAEDILPYFEKLVKHVANLHRIHLFFCGMIPSPKFDSTTSGKNFSKASSLLRKLCTKNSMKATFINLAQIFTHNGIIKTEFFSSKDGVHLTHCKCIDKSKCKCKKPLGAELFAQELFNQLEKLPKNKISYN